MSTDNRAFDYVNKIWSIADYVRDVIRPADYNKLILPFAVLRRFECALEPTRDAVSARKKKGTWSDDDPNYTVLSGHCFWNVTNYTLSDLGTNHTYDALMTYINGFSENAREVLLKFKMENTCKELDDQGMLYEVCTRFSKFDLGSDSIDDRLMSDIYEHLIERYGEEISQDAEDFMTPRDVVRLATSLLFANEDTLLNADNGDVKALYDGSCGTCGFISDALDVLDEWHEKGTFNAPTRIVPYGQELEPATWAMGKSALMLRNVAGGFGDAADRMSDFSDGIKQGDTLSGDLFPYMTFNYQLTNPPYGKKWKKEQSEVLDEVELGDSGRFPGGVPSISDGSMLFMQNVASKMASIEDGGGKAAIVLSGSSLFNSQAGSSDIRRWFFEHDLIECIVKLPTDIFFRTGIATYIWIFNNHKTPNRTHKIQLIDASECKTSLLKTLGNKRFEIGERDIDWIVRTYVDGHDHDRSVIVDDAEFMYRSVSTRRPMHVAVIPNIERINEFFNSTKPMQNLDDKSKQLLSDWIRERQEDGVSFDYSETEEIVGTLHQKINAKSGKGKPTKQKLLDAMVSAFGDKLPRYPLAMNSEGEVIFDPKLDDTENVPYEMDIDDYMAKEVLPFAPDTEINTSVRDAQDGEVGVVKTSISFNRYFYKYEQPRDPEVIASEIIKLEEGLGEELRGLLQ